MKFKSASPLVPLYNTKTLGGVGLLLSNGDVYKGLTDDLKRRFIEHKTGKVVSTKNYRPVKLIGYEAYLVKTDAERREKFLKTTEGRRLLNQQYRDIINSLRNNK